MPVDKTLKKVMVIGSGPIIIGQAAEFDYAGTQACLALKEEGIQVVLVNSNPATIMTDTQIAHRVYMEPLTPEFVARIIRTEKPDGLLPTLGGQVGLNIAVSLYESGILREEGVRLLGTSVEAIKKAEDRELFKGMMADIGEPVPDSTIVTKIEQAFDFAQKVGLPLIVRPAYTLGGTGGGVAYTREQLEEIVSLGLKASLIGQVLLEKSLLGFKEIEYEVMRDGSDNCITVCNMENIDPVGIHTGDSIVVAPVQTISSEDDNMLKAASMKIIRALGIQGGCNIQFALDPKNSDYYVIEVNPRVSRSSALASKATGYPIARVAAKVALGFSLDEIKSPITGNAWAALEPDINYVVLKIPRWPFDKFAVANRTLGTQMKATGEVMSIDTNFEGALMKAVRSLELGLTGLDLLHLKQVNMEKLMERISSCDDERLFVIAEVLRRGISVDEISKKSAIDPYFIIKISNLVAMEQKLRQQTLENITADELRQAKRMGFPDAYIEELMGVDSGAIRELRRKFNIHPGYKAIDTSAAEAAAGNPYFYSSYEAQDEAECDDSPKVIVLGSGPIRIGQGIEFDYCSVHSAWAIRQTGVKTIIINNNPETVSTDFSTSDRLYFEPLTPEDVLNIIEKESPLGVIVQFGGQTAVNLAEPLKKAGIKILGTSVDSIDIAEDRERFDALMAKLGIPRPAGRIVTRAEDAVGVARTLGYPVVVRPSYVLGGRAMEIVYNDAEMTEYIETAVKVSNNHPVLVDRYLTGKEVEVDAVCDGEKVLIPGIMEHIERAGVHSGDSTAVYPHRHIKPETVDSIVDYTNEICRALKVVGVINIQFVIHEGKVYVIEVNPRSSRTVPFISKATGVPVVNLATRAMLGETLSGMGYPEGLWPAPGIVAVKVPVFSFNKLRGVDVSLGPEMKSTGEVMGIDEHYSKALYKAYTAAGLKVPTEGGLLATIADKDKIEALPILKGFSDMGFKIYATAGTAAMLSKAGIPVIKVNKLREEQPNIIDHIRHGEIDLVVNTLTRGKTPERDGFKIRRAAVENNIPCLTSLDTAKALMDLIDNLAFKLIPLC
jgi:carbamoyl-phosphate synthase large subunit